MQRYYDDPAARVDFSDTMMLSQICAADFAAAYYSDGFGALWDLVRDPDSQELIAQLPNCTIGDVHAHSSDTARPRC